VPDLGAAAPRRVRRGALLARRLGLVPRGVRGAAPARAPVPARRAGARRPLLGRRDLRPRRRPPAARRRRALPRVRRARGRRALPPRGVRLGAARDRRAHPPERRGARLRLLVHRGRGVLPLAGDSRMTEGHDLLLTVLVVLPIAAGTV